MTWVVELRTEWLTPIMRGFSFLGDETFFLILLPLIFWSRYWRTGVQVGILALASIVLNDFLKGIFQVPRPDLIPHLVEASGWNFPSGHAQTAMVLWGWLAYRIKHRWAWIVAGILIFGIALSRVYLGVHDIPAVAGGILIGGLLIVLFDRIIHTRLVAWEGLGAGRQSMILLVLLLAAYAAFPDYADPAIKGGATWFGFCAGILISKRWGVLAFSGGYGVGIGRLLVGFVGLFGIYLGLKGILAWIGFQGVVATWIRYTLLGGWVAVGAPWSFERLGWVSRMPVAGIQSAGDSEGA